MSRDHLLATTSDPQWISEDVLFAIHAQQIERYGGLHGILDKNVVKSALVRAINRWAYDDNCDMADLAATYLVGFAGTQGFNDGNKRTGVACALLFLAINGIPWEGINPQQLQQLAFDISNNLADVDRSARFFRSQITRD